MSHTPPQSSGRLRWLLRLPRPIRFFLARRAVDLWQLKVFLVFLLVDVLALAFVRRGNSGAVVVVKIDSIGDYILFHDYLRAVRAHPAYRGRRIVLCANVLIRDLAETFDREFVDEFVWIDRGPFFSHLPTRFRVLRRLKQLGADVVLNPMFGRTLMESDAVVHATAATERIGFTVPGSGAIWAEKTGWIFWNPHWYQAVANRFYTRLVPHQAPLFEFELNGIFFKAVLGDTLLPSRPTLDPSAVKISEPARPFAVLLPGAGERHKEWPVANFGRIARHLQKAYGLAIVVAGTAADHEKAQGIQEASGGAVLDLTGKLTLPQLDALIARGEITVANDSGGIHIAAALQKRGVGIATRTGLVHFHPYPENLRGSVHFVYPPVIREAESPTAFIEQNPGFFMPASDIEIAAVLDAIEAVLQGGKSCLGLGTS